MVRRFSAFAFCCLTFSLLLTAPAQALPDPESLCANACGSPGIGDPCSSCRAGFNTWTTCGQYWGRPANDLDGDGVVNTSDNCQCAANSNQANCDGDASGDACDYQDNSWRLITVGTRNCFLDEDQHWDGTTLELYYQNVYRSTCTGQTCYNKYLRSTTTCSWGSNTYNCCNNKWGSIECGGVWNVDNCGLPRCNF
jgi:hypothetical protein